MKKIFNCLLLSFFLLTTSLIKAEVATVATIAEAKKLDSNSSVIFTGELTLQYVAISAEGVNYYAFDSNNEFIRLRSYYWADLS